MSAVWNNVRRYSLWMAVAALVLLAPTVLAADGGAYSLRLATTLAMYVALAYSWNMIGGVAGYPSFSTAAFFGLGAYIGGLLQPGAWPWHRRRWLPVWVRDCSRHCWAP